MSVTHICFSLLYFSQKLDPLISPPEISVHLFFNLVLIRKVKDQLLYLFIWWSSEFFRLHCQIQNSMILWHSSFIAFKVALVIRLFIGSVSRNHNPDVLPIALLFFFFLTLALCPYVGPTPTAAFHLLLCDMHYMPYRIKCHQTVTWNPYLFLRLSWIGAMVLSLTDKRSLSSLPLDSLTQCSIHLNECAMMRKSLWWYWFGE